MRSSTWSTPSANLSNGCLRDQQTAYNKPRKLGIMTLRTKWAVSLALGTVLIIVLLLSTSLSGLRLEAGAPFPGSAGGATSAQGQAKTAGSASVAFPLLEAILGVALVVLAILVPVRLLPFISIRRLLLAALGIVLLIVLLNILPGMLSGPPSLVAAETPVPTAPGFSPSQVTPLGEPPSAFLWLAAGCLLAGASALAVRLILRAQKTVGARTALVQTAEDALSELAAGKDFSSVIIRCYLQMSQVLRTERKIERPQHMTAHEFQEELELEGLPKESVERLTLLFEKARYGAEPMSWLDEDAGRESLEQIVRSVRAGSAEGR